MVILGFAGFGWVLVGFGGWVVGGLVWGLVVCGGVVGDWWYGLRPHGVKKGLCVGVLAGIWFFMRLSGNSFRGIV